MFFQDLTNLRKRQISKYDIDILDWWLGTRKQNHKKYLNPLQFSIDCKIDAAYALNLFSICVLDENVKLLSVRYIIRCQICESVLYQQTDVLNSNNVNGKCGECGSISDIQLLVDNAEIYFTLLKKPEYLSNKSFENPIGVSLGKLQACKGLV